MIARAQNSCTPGTNFLRCLALSQMIVFNLAFKPNRLGWLCIGRTKFTECDTQNIPQVQIIYNINSILCTSVDSKHQSKPNASNIFTNNMINSMTICTTAVIDCPFRFMKKYEVSHSISHYQRHKQRRIESHSNQHQQ